MALSHYFSAAIELFGVPARLPNVPALFRPKAGDETKWRPNETILGFLQTLAKNSGNGRFVLTGQTTKATKA
jgi:hypothetical protein